MKTLSKLLLALLLCCALPALQAQEPPAGDAGADAAAATEADVDATEDEPVGPDAVPVEEAVVTLEEDVPEDTGPLVEEDPAIAASAEEEFDPDEEISEDYPVPLPSDI